MKFRNLALFFAFVFCLLIVMFCQSAEEEKPLTQTKELIAKLIHVSKDAEELFTEKAKQSLIEEVLTFKVTLERDFLPNTDKAPLPTIGDFLEEKHAILEDITTQYGRAKKKDDFNRIFREGKINKAAELKVGRDKIKVYIYFKHITVDLIEEAREVDGEPVNMISRVIFTYHIKPKGGSFAENLRGGGSGELLHRNICRWH